MKRRNFGGQKAQLTGPGGIKLDLGKMVQEEQAKRQHEAHVNNMIFQTGALIYAGMIGRDFDPLQPIEPESLRTYANAARNAAAYYAETMGLVVLHHENATEECDDDSSNVNHSEQTSEAAHQVQCDESKDHAEST